MADTPRIRRKSRLQRSAFKRQGHQFEAIIRKGKRIRKVGYRGDQWIQFKHQYMSKLPEMVECHYCALRGRGRPRPKHKMTLDHKNGRVGPLLTDEKNIVVACFRCNQDKGSTMYDKYVERIKNGPTNQRSN